MRDPKRRSARIGAALAGAALALAARGAVTTTVSLVRQDAAAPKLALPSIEVRVNGPDRTRSRVVAAALAGDVARRAHTRAPDRGEIADYAISVELPAPEGASQRFSASLVAADGDVVWLVEGVTRSDDGPIADSALSGVARNVLSALVRDGWLQAKYDPDDPPPPPPIVDRGKP